MMQQQFLVTFVVVLLSLVSAGVTSQLEEQSRLLIIAQAILNQERPTILRDHLNFLWVAGGAILGGYVAVALRQVTGLFHIVRCFAVAVATALAVTPYLLVTYFGPAIAPESCFLLGFLIAVGAWLAWEVVSILALRLKKAARERGWLGVKEEVMGDRRSHPPR
ncbi:MAG: hypothetical protein U0796_04190 [Gemmatales bacterium]